MCGRFTREYSWRDVHDFLDLKFPGDLELKPSWNVAPTQVSPVGRVAREGRRAGARELALMRWGLVPFWAKDVGIGSKMINARGETVAEKPAFRAAFKRRRCVVPVSGFYEWKKTGEMRSGKPVKQPYYIHPVEGDILGFAGLWEEWDKGDGPLETFTIITTEANAMMAELHDRMPVILDPADFERWLDPGLEDASDLIRPAPEGTLDCRPVSTRVNSPRNDDAGLVEGESNGLF